MAASDEPPVAASGGDLKAALAQLAESVVGLARTRGELAAIELSEERERLLLRLALLVAGIVMVAFALLFASAFVVMLFWDTHRLAALAAVAIAWLIAGAGLLLRARAIGHDAPRPFAATFAELDKDRVRLARGFDNPDAES